MGRRKTTCELKCFNQASSAKHYMMGMNRVEVFFFIPFCQQNDDDEEEEEEDDDGDDGEN